MTTIAGGPARILLAEVAGAVPGWYGPGARLLQGAPVQRRSWSVHVLPTVESAGGRRIPLVVKVPLWEEAPDLEAALAAGPQASTRAEFETLRRIEAMTDGDPRFAAVRAVGYLPAVNALVTERLAARPLRSVRRGRSAAVARAGAWLRAFHDGPGAARSAAAGPDDLAHLIAGLEVPSDAPVPLRQAAEAALQAAVALEGRRLRLAVNHGDLGASNVLVTGDGRVAVLDPNLEPGPVEADLAKLAVALRTSRLRLSLGIPAGRRHAPERALLEGYGGVDEEVYRLCRRAAAVRRWVEVEQAAGGLLRRMVRRPARRVLRRESS